MPGYLPDRSIVYCGLWGGCLLGGNRVKHGRSTLGGLPGTLVQIVSCAGSTMQDDYECAVGREATHLLLENSEGGFGATLIELFVKQRCLMDSRLRLLSPILQPP